MSVCMCDVSGQQAVRMFNRSSFVAFGLSVTVFLFALRLWQKSLVQLRYSAHCCLQHLLKQKRFKNLTLVRERSHLLKTTKTQPLGRERARDKTKSWELAPCDVTKDTDTSLMPQPGVCLALRLNFFSPFSTSGRTGKCEFSRTVKINVVVGGYKQRARWAVFCRLLVFYRMNSIWLLYWSSMWPHESGKKVESLRK